MVKEISDWHIKDETKSDRPMAVTGKAMSQKSGKLSEVMADTQFAIFPKLLTYHYGFQSDGFHIY